MRLSRLILTGVAAAALTTGAALAQTSTTTSNTTTSTGSNTTGATGQTGTTTTTGVTNTTGASNMTGSSNMTGAAGGQAGATTGASVTASGPYRPITSSTSSSIVTVLQQSGQFTVLLKALQATNLTSVLQGPGALTLFAPTDAAFQALPAGQLDTLLKPENAPQLQKLLTYHLVNLPIRSSELKGKAATNTATVNGKAVHLDDLSGAFKVNDASVIQSDVKASNGSIQVIDHLLSTDYTPPAVEAAAATTSDETKATTTKSSTTSTKKAARKRKGG